MSELSLFTAFPAPVFQALDGFILWANEAFRKIFPAYQDNISEAGLFGQPVSLGITDNTGDTTIVLTLPEGIYLARPFMAGEKLLFCMTLAASPPPDGYRQVDAIAQKMRSPLSSMQIAFSRLIPRWKELDSESDLFLLESMAQNFYRLTRLATNASNLAELSGDNTSYGMEDHDLAEICRDIVNEARLFVASRGVELVFDDETEPVFISTNRILIERAVYNLISNSVMAQTQGIGLVSSPGGIVRLSLRTSEDAVLLTVDDNGPGFDDQSYAKAFSILGFDEDVIQPARTSLGLPLVAAIARHLGGIVIINNRSPGPRVTLSFPRVTTGRLKSSSRLNYVHGFPKAKLELSDIPVGSTGLFLPAGMKKLKT